MRWSLEKSVSINLLRDEAVELANEIRKSQLDKVRMLSELLKVLDAALEIID